VTISIPVSQKNVYIYVILCCLTAGVSDLTFCTATKCNSHSNSLATIFSVHNLETLLTFRVQNFISIFRYLGRSKESVQVCGPM